MNSEKIEDGVTLVGYVVIGRNEGERLKDCLVSVIRSATKVVYVDSGSSDGSVEMARAMGIDVVELDMSVPFTAARARNEGYWRLRKIIPKLEYVHFVDGDCELAYGWHSNAVRFLDQHEDMAVVCGRLRERYPKKSIYNNLCDMEWETAVGELKSCGGVAMFRVSAFEIVQGFRNDLIAGEEPELCIRLRASGWRIWCLGDDMALHDAAMVRLGQWWRRTLRAGFVYAQGVSLHGVSSELHGIKESLSAWFWGLGIPLGVAGFAFFSWPWAVLLFCIYPLQITRLALHGCRSKRENWLRAFFLVLGKFPELLGQMRFFYHKCEGKQSRLIEYK